MLKKPRLRENSKTNLHRNTVLFAVILLSAGLRIAASLWLGDTLDGAEQVRVMDQISYHRLAKSILAGSGYTFDIDWYPFTPAHAPTAHWSFLYPLYLAGVYAITGVHPLAARIVQCLISACLSAVLLYRIGRRLFGERAGLAAAGMGAGYMYFIFYDASLMTESFFLLGTLAMLDLASQIAECQRAGAHPPWHLWASLGIVLGITALLRQTILLWAPFLIVWLVWEGSGKVRWGQIAFALSLTLLVILPWTVRNYLVYQTFLPLNSNAGYAFYSANHPDHGVRFDQDYAAPLPTDLTAQNLNEAQLSSALMARGLQFILDDPARYVRLSLGRIPIFFNFWFSDESTLSSNLMRVLSYGLYLPFFLYGLFLSFNKHWRRFSLFYWFAFVYAVMHILTWASVRYRLPIDAALMPFAGCALVDLWQRARRGLNLKRPAKLVSSPTFPEKR